MSKQEYIGLRRLNLHPSLPRIPGQAPVNVSTVFRWALRGLQTASGVRVKLHTIKVGGVRVTCVQWVEDFIAATSATMPDAPTIRTPGQRARDVEAATKKLEEWGMIEIQRRRLRRAS